MTRRLRAAVGVGIARVLIAAGIMVVPAPGFGTSLLLLLTLDHLGREITGVLPFGTAGSRYRGMLLSPGRGT